MSNLIEVIKRDISLLDYAQSRGFTLERRGNHGEYFCKEMDSMSINTEKNLFHRRSNGVGGSVIDFVMMVDEVDLNTAVSILRKDLPEYYQKDAAWKPRTRETFKQKEVVFSAPEKNKEGFKRLFAYLIKTRHLAPQVVQEMVNRNMLYEDKHHNCAFLGYNEKGKASYYTLRGTYTPPDKKPFKLEPEGSDKTIGWYVNNQKNRLFVVESPIEAMSVMTMLALHGKDPKQYNFLALGTSGTVRSLSHWLKNADPPIDTIYLSLNKDEAGLKGMKKLRTALREDLAFTGKVIDKLPVEKDFNDDLKKLAAERTKCPALAQS